MKPTMRSLEIGAVGLLLIAIGIVRFSQVTEWESKEVELAARLEVLYLLESDHYEKNRKYFDPTAAEFEPYLYWLDHYDCDVRWSRKSFAVIARADFDGDGSAGVWRIDQKSPVAQRLIED